jgi:hypothetical protein
VVSNALGDVFRVAGRGEASLKNTFDAACSFTKETFSGAPAITVTDILPNFNCHVSLGATNCQSTNHAGAQINNTTQARQDLAMTKGAYLAADRSIVNEIQGAMAHAIGPAAAKQIMAGLLPAAPTSDTASLAVNIATGNAGTVYDMAREFKNALNGPKGPEIREAIDKALNTLQRASMPACMRLDSEKVNSIPTPVGNYDNVTGPQLIAYLQRDCSKDPVMRDIALAEMALDKIDQENGIIKAHYGDKLTGDKIEERMRGGESAAAIVAERPDVFSMIDDVIYASTTTQCWAQSMRGLQVNDTPVSEETRAEIDKKPLEPAGNFVPAAKVPPPVVTVGV